jgi:Zn-finger nucleic acid-binding protein
MVTLTITEPDFERVDDDAYHLQNEFESAKKVFFLSDILSES